MLHHQGSRWRPGRPAAAALCAAAVVICAGATPAYALAPPSPPATTVPPDARTRAKELYLAAERVFAAGDYENATVIYRLAYDLLPDPVFLFNIAQCQRLIGKRELAIDYYREFLKARPDAPNRADVEALIGALELEALHSPETTVGRATAPDAARVSGTLGSPALAASPGSALPGTFALTTPATGGAPAGTAAPRGRLSAPGLALALAGAALGGAGAWTGTRVLAARAAVDHAGRDTAADFEEISGALRRGRTFSVATTLLVSAGGMAFTAGFTLVLVRLAAPGRSVAVSAAVGADGAAGLTVSGSFGGAAR
ncbi:MAG TPA: tetratricopeptide repeat protein [Myxococcota bacterium]|jgi:hypothetical protein|nr:tetratricopeptide repeat protein [Myxococcota bacterium]